MQVFPVFDSQFFYSQDGGTIRDTVSKATSAALNAKSVELFLSITELETLADVQVVVKWESSADGHNWYAVGTMLDTNAGAAGKATTKVYTGDSASSLIGAYNRFTVGVQELNATPTTQVYVVASLKAVYKPF